MNNQVTSIADTMLAIGKKARAAARSLNGTSAQQRSRAIQAIADNLRSDADRVIAGNLIDVESARDKGVSAAVLDRLCLDASRIEAMASSLEVISGMPDTLGKVSSEWRRPNGLTIQRVSVPLGVIGMIYESRPNVTTDAAALCLKSGNAVILRGGSESFSSNQAIHDCISSALVDTAIGSECVQFVPTRDRAAVGYLLSSMRKYVDVVVPRGGRSLVQRVQDEATIPVIGHLEGICHVYLHEQADVSMAVDIALNAKMRRPGICGAAETILVDEAVANSIVAPVCEALRRAGCEIRGDQAICEIVGDAVPAAERDWSTEYLDAIVSIRVVGGISAAVEHIARYGSGHTECIVTKDQSAADRFLSQVDSAIVLHNASTQFADGGEFGMGAEIGIATDKIHARGPVGAEQLTSYKYVVRGDGQIRD